MLVGPATGPHGRRVRLPAEASEFVGRSSELRRIEALLRENRLVTLIGPGGIGKTRLALRAATRVAAAYTDGIGLIELSALRDPGLLPPTIASCLGLPEPSAGGPLQGVLAQLASRNLLLILDPCEHLVDACALFAEAVLAGAPSVTVLAASREPLAVTGERCYPVPPLELPARPTRAAGALTASSPRTDAVALFARCAAATSGFEMTDANRPDVIRLCQQLDGIPLAIELAAVRLMTMPLTELADRLEHRLEHRLTLLTGANHGDGSPGDGSRGDGGGHQTLRASIGWSYDLCTPAERALWARLSVFAGSFDLTAAEEVGPGGELSRDDIFGTILRLVDKSVLLHAGPAPDRAGPDQPLRLRMLDTVREFGAEQLAASGAETATRGRHIAHYLAMARYFRDHLVDDGQLARFTELRREHDNIRAALEYALGAEPGQRERERERERDGAELAAALYAYWASAGLMLEGAHWLGQALDRCRAPSLQRAWALTARCYLGAIQGETARAVADGRESLRLAASFDDPLLTGRGYVSLGLALAMSGEAGEAARAGEQARRLLTPLADRAGLILLEAHLGHLALLTGHPEQAIDCYHRGLDLLGASRRTDDSERWLHGYLHVMVAFAFYRLPGRDAECTRTLQLALVAKHELGEMTGTAYALEILGWVAARTGHYRRAAWLLGAAGSLWERLGTRLGAAEPLQEQHRQAIASGRAALGEQRFDALLACGAYAPLDDMVELAVADANEPGIGVPPIPLPGTLTDREREIAVLAAGGMRTGKIAESLFISEHAVAVHLDQVRAKIGVASPEQLAGWFRGNRA